MKKQIPTEYEEAITFVEWMRYQNIDHWHIPQETYTTSWAVKMKNQRQGVRRGVPDFFIFLEKEKTNINADLCLWIELKRTKGGKPTPEQLDFLEKINRIPCTQGAVCYGADDAIEFVKKFLKI